MNTYKPLFVLITTFYLYQHGNTFNGQNSTFLYLVCPAFCYHTFSLDWSVYFRLVFNDYCVLHRIIAIFSF